MKKKLIALAFAVTSPLAFAGGYVGGSYSAMEASVDGFDGDLSLGTINVTGGYQLNDYTAVEVRAGLGVGDDSYSGVEFEIDNYVGAYVKVGVPAGDFYPYALAGFTRGKVTASASGASASDSESDTSFGVGVAYNVSEQVSLSAEYANLLDKDGVTIDGFTFGVNYNF